MTEELPKVGEQNEFERSKIISELQSAIDTGLSSGPDVFCDPETFKRKMHKLRN